jgi:CRISPR-associated protein Cmr6
MHAASVDVPTLRRLEAAVWGDTGTGGAVRVEVEHLGTWNPELYDKASKARMSDAEKKGGYGIPGCDPRKTTQGLWYASYGMHEKDKRRWLVPPGSRWEIRLSARSGRFPADAPAGKKLPAKVLLSQARAALWLLCRFGGVGSKPRKGFGSFRDIAVEGIAVVEDCLRFAREFRQACSVDGKPQREPGSSALDVMLGPLEVGLTWKDPWFALDQAGFAAQAFAQGGKHQDKSALGLPRRGSRDGPKGKRYASPVHYHLARGVDGRLAIRVVAFPANLPDFGTSREVMGRLLESLRADLARRAALPEPTPHQPGPGGQQQRDFRSGGHDEAGPRPAPATSTPPAKRPHGTGVTVKILGRRDKGGYRVQEAGRPEGALVLGTEPQPPPEVGAEVSVFLKDDGPPPQYTWDQPKPTGGGATPRRHVRR